MRNLLPRTVRTGFDTWRLDVPHFYLGPLVWGMMGVGYPLS